MLNVVHTSLYVCTYICICSTVANDVLVETPAGQIFGTAGFVRRDGTKAKEFTEFLGIPYAEPPTGNLRFEKPVPKGRFRSPYYANSRTNISCPGVGYHIYPSYSSVVFNEDCLLLNVFVPGSISNKTNKATMIYIHGGSFNVGSQNTFRAPEFVVDAEMILVTLNYRLGVFGFLADNKTGLKGNYGLWDQHVAIQWVHDNIAAFGGDPDKVILVGNSAGGGSVLYQALYPGNKGLFHGVIAESGSPVSYWAYDPQPHDTFVRVMVKVGCNVTSESAIDCLRKVPSRTLSNTMLVNPTVDGEFIPVYPDRLTYEQCFGEASEVLNSFADVNIIVGVSSNDGGYVIPAPRAGDYRDGMSFTRACYSVKKNKEFTQKYGHSKSILNEYFNGKNISLYDKDHTVAQIYLNIEKDITFTVPAFEILNLHATRQGSGRTYFYIFDHRPVFSVAPSWMQGASHADELPYVFRFAETLMWDFFKIPKEVISEVVDDTERVLSNTIMKHWVQFAESGNPNIVGEDDVWPEFEPVSQKHVVFKVGDGTYVEQGAFYEQEKVQFWRRLIAAWLRNTTQSDCVRQSLEEFIPLPAVREDICYQVYIDDHLKAINNGSLTMNPTPIYKGSFLLINIVTVIHYWLT